jgi:hypothetical protein
MFQGFGTLQGSSILYQYYSSFFLAQQITYTETWDFANKTIIPATMCSDLFVPDADPYHRSHLTF